MQTLRPSLKMACRRYIISTSHSIPFMIAGGNKMPFGMLHRSGEVTPCCMLCAAHVQALPFCQCYYENRPAETTFLQCELCSHTLDVTLLRHRIIQSPSTSTASFLCSSARPQTLNSVQCKTRQRGGECKRAHVPLHCIFPQLELTLAPCWPENTTIIRHRFKIEKIILFFDECLERFCHSFEDIKVG